MLEPESFDVCKNAIAPIIVILGHSEVNYYKMNYSLICNIWTLGALSEIYEWFRSSIMITMMININIDNKE